MVQMIAGTVLTPAQQASNILRAWVRRDPEALRHEFSIGLALCSSSRMPALEEEQLDLLRAVVERLDDYPDTWTARSNDPVVKLCITLLMHLSDQG
jgi:hypothetical protein